VEREKKKEEEEGREREETQREKKRWTDILLAWEKLKIQSIISLSVYPFHTIIKLKSHRSNLWGPFV
jgi:hypothetical protein